jgi:hypothetical protein
MSFTSSSPHVYAVQLVSRLQQLPSVDGVDGVLFHEVPAKVADTAAPTKIGTKYGVHGTSSTVHAIMHAAPLHA